MREVTSIQQRAGAAALALSLLLAGAATAEVRVRRDVEPVLDVLVTPAGPWTVVSPLDGSVLNPGGDAFADGLPGSGTRPDELLAAWMRGTCGDLRITRWDGDAWESWDSLIEPTAIGVPRVSPLGDGWALTWQRAGDVLEITAVGASGRGDQGVPVALFEGLLLDSMFVDDVQIVLYRNPAAGRFGLAGILWSVPGVPSPIDVLWRDELSLGDLGNASPQSVDPDSPEWPGTSLEPSEWPDAVVISWGGESFEVHVLDGEVTRLDQRKETGKPTVETPKRGQRKGHVD